MKNTSCITHKHADGHGYKVVTTIKIVMTISTMAMLAAFRSLYADVVYITQGSTSGYTMTDGNTYVIQNSVSFSNAAAGGSGVTVADGATVVVYVPTGIVLTATGANGSGQIGGGAGICIPSNAILIVTGEGSVNAIGGDAGDGGNGADGLLGTLATRYNGQYSKGTGKGSSGVGGSGGYGGGGAGAGIGETGANGGDGGEGGSARVVSSYVHYFNFCGNGGAGEVGVAGSSGKAMGVCYAIGTVIIDANGGSHGASGKAGNSTNWIEEANGYYWVDFASCGGGGGGGGGGGNSPSCAIGGGGASGGGGGGGGSGALTAAYYLGYSICNANGGGGIGGKSLAEAGVSGPEKGSTWGGTSSSCSVYYGGDGGEGGAAGIEGGTGTLYVSPTAKVDVERDKLSATTHPAAQYTITFDANGGHLVSSIESLTGTLGCELPDCVPTPMRNCYAFNGWRTVTGEEYYGASGAKSISSYPIASNIVLYAQWEEVAHTTTTPVPVPHSYFDISCPTLLAEYGGDYEATSLATAKNGCNKVWECYVAGINPTNATEKFMARIVLAEGVPVVTWNPNKKMEREYKIWGSTNLVNGGDWECPTNALHRFFKVTVEMP